MNHILTLNPGSSSIKFALFEWVDDMPTLIRAADCILCKARGLTVSEALAFGRPILLADVIKGQETGNAEYVIRCGAGEMAEDPVQSLEIPCHCPIVVGGFSPSAPIASADLASRVRPTIPPSGYGG